MARKRTLKYEVDLDTRKAIKSADKLTDAAEDTEEALEDVETAGKQVARALERSADDMIDEIDATARAVEALDLALGDAADNFDSREVVADLKQIGLTAEQIEADADDLAHAIRRVEDVEVHSTAAGFDDVSQSVGRVRDQTDRASGAMSGFIGGTVGELPLISDAMGPVGEGLGQLTEGAIEGEIGFKNLALAAGGMGAVALTMKLIGDRLDEASRVDAWNTEQVDAYKESLEEADGVLDAINTKLRDQGDVEVNFFGDAKTIVPLLNQVGLSVDDFSTLVEGGQGAIDEWGSAMRAAGVGSDQIGLVMHALTGEMEALAEAQEAAAASNEFFASTQDSVNRSYADFVEETEGVPELVDEFDRMAEALDAGVAPSLEDVQTVMERLNVDEAEAIRLADDHRQALRDQAEAADNLRRRVEDYSDELGGIPDDIETEILALIDEGDLARAEAKLTHLTRYREITIGLTGAGAPFAGGSDFFFARGGTTGPQGGVAGENYRPELVDGRLVTGPTAVPAATKVTGEAETRRMLASRPTVTRHVTVNVGPGYGPEDIERITRTYDQQNGRRRVS